MEGNEVSGVSDGMREGEGLPEQPTPSGYDQWRGYEPWPGANAGMPPPPRYIHVPPPTPPPARGGKRLLVGLVAALVIVSGAFGAWIGGGRDSATNGPRTAASGAAPVQPGASTNAVASAVSPAVVNIDTFAASFGSHQLSPLGAGTGMILTSSGEVLTNNHVVEGAMRIDVSIQGQTNPVTANVVGVDPSHDVALLQLQGVSGLPTVTLGQPDGLTVGQNVIAIGNALGKGGAPTVTTGSVSGLHRSITASDPAGAANSEHLTDVIATDAPIVPGDSGGALVDGSGRVVGMITAGGTRTDQQGAGNVGFAIPVDNALTIVNQMRAGQGSDTILLGDRGFLGVAVHALDPATASQLQVDAGALVVGVEPNGPAANIGMTDPAVITQVDGHAIKSYTDLGTWLHAHVPGDQVSITWVDRLGSHTATATLTAGGPAV
jgi:S1-C subfamily serine protease